MHHTEPRLRDTGQRRVCPVCHKVIGASIRRVSWQPTEMSAGKERKHWSNRTLEGADGVARTRIRFDDALAKHVQEHVALKTAKRTCHHHQVARVHLTSRIGTGTEDGSTGQTPQRDTSRTTV